MKEVGVVGFGKLGSLSPCLPSPKFDSLLATKSLLLEASWKNRSGEEMKQR